MKLSACGRRRPQLMGISIRTEMQSLNEKLTLLVSTILESKLTEKDSQAVFTSEQIYPDMFPIPLDIERVLGKGAFGTVYLATELNLERRVALKVFHSARPEDLDFNRREGRMIARLDHDNIVIPYFSGTAKDGRWFIASKYIRGTDLARISSTHNLSYEEIVQLLMQISSAVAYAHEEG